MTEDVFLEEDGGIFVRKKWSTSEDRWFGLN